MLLFFSARKAFFSATIPAQILLLYPPFAISLFFKDIE